MYKRRTFAKGEHLELFCVQMHLGYRVGVYYFVLGYGWDSERRWLFVLLITVVRLWIGPPVVQNDVVLVLAFSFICPFFRVDSFTSA